MNPKNFPLGSTSQDVIQDMLRSVLGKHFVVALFISEAATGDRHYHLRIDHEPTAVNLEHHDKLKDGFVEDIFALATRMKSMLERRETLSRMDGTGTVKLLTWISDDVHPALMQASEHAQRICLDALNRDSRDTPTRPDMSFQERRALQVERMASDESPLPAPPRFSPHQSGQFAGQIDRPVAP